MEYIVFYGLAAVALCAALAVIVVNRVMHSALALVICFGAIAGLFFQLNAQFIAAVQVIIYAGAIMVLFLFVIMLLDPEAEKFSPDRLKKIVVIALPFTVLLVFLLTQVTLHGLEDAETSLHLVGDAQSIGRLLFHDYLLAFEITSILILSAVLGAIVLTRRSE